MGHALGPDSQGPTNKQTDIVIAVGYIAIPLREKIALRRASNGLATRFLNAAILSTRNGKGFIRAGNGFHFFRNPS